MLYNALTTTPTVHACIHCSQSKNTLNFNFCLFMFIYISACNSFTASHETPDLVGFVFNYCKSFHVAFWKTGISILRLFAICFDDPIGCLQVFRKFRAFCLVILKRCIKAIIFQDESVTKYTMLFAVGSRDDNVSWGLNSDNI